MVLAIVALLVGIFGITSNAIGINDIKDHKAARKYLIVSLVGNILIVLGSLVYLWLYYNTGGAGQLLKLF